MLEETGMNATRLLRRVRQLAATLLAAGLTAAAGLAAAAPGPDEITTELLVKLRRGTDLQPLLARYPLALAGRFGARPIFRFRVTGSARPKDVLARLLLEPSVMLAETNSRQASPEARKNMAWAIGQPDAYAAQWAPAALRLPAAQRLATGRGVRVAVLDTGVDGRHPALTGRMLPGRDFVDADRNASEPVLSNGPAWGHGTHVAGLIALVAPNARIMPVRVLDPDGLGNSWVLAEALLWAADPDGNPDTDDGADVINLSLGTLARTDVLDAIARIAACQPAVAGDPVADRSDPGYADDERRCAAGRGAVLVAAAGNDGSRVRQYPAAEGVYGLISVGASRPDGTIAAFSNFGSWVRMAAPGLRLTSTLPGGHWGSWSGTSMAAPLVAGTAALVRERAPALQPKEVVQRMRRATALSCDDVLPLLDAYAAVAGTRAPDRVCP